MEEHSPIETLGENIVTVDGVLLPVEIAREHTLIETPKGKIAVIHEITLGEIILTVAIVAFFIFNVFERLVRR